MDDRQKKLLDLALSIKDAELAMLNVAERTRQRLGQERSDVATGRRKAIPDGPPDAAYLSGAGDRWQFWCNRRLGELSSEEARAAAAAEAQKQRAARAFGRAAALAQVLSRENRKIRRL